LHFLYGDIIPKIVKYGKDLAVLLPDEIVKKLDLKPNTQVRVYEITPGTIAIEKFKPVNLTDEEIKLIKKILQIKFEERTPEKVISSLSQSEKDLLYSLTKRKVVHIYYGGKYSQNGVYHVPPSVFQQIVEKTGSEQKEQAQSDDAEKKSQIKSDQKTEIKEHKDERKKEVKEEKIELDEDNAPKILNKQGYLVLNSESEAREISEILADKIKKNQIIGIRGFDKKYYIVKNSFILKHQSKIKSILKHGPLSSEKIASELGMEQEAVNALLTILREEGEILEKRKGVFVLLE